MERLGRNWSNLPRELQREMDQVRELMEQAADQGHLLAMQNLGNMDQYGIGVAQSLVKAWHWYKMAAEGGLAAAQYFLAGYYYSGNEGVAVDLARARMWNERAAAQGHAGALYNLGYMHRNGEGGPQDLARARELYEQAAAQGDAGAMVNIGGLLADGKDMEQDLNEAMRWFLKAKAHGADTSEQMAWVIGERGRQRRSAGHGLGTWPLDCK